MIFLIIGLWSFTLCIAYFYGYLRFIKRLKRAFQMTARAQRLCADAQEYAEWMSKDADMLLSIVKQQGKIIGKLSQQQDDDSKRADWWRDES
jgi:biopolymer transport protein ExbB/TolQ